MSGQSNAIVASVPTQAEITWRIRPVHRHSVTLYPLTNGTISSYNSAMRRKSGALVPLEASILEAGLDLRRRGLDAAHGFLLAKEMRDRADARLLTAYGTLYKALARLEKVGFLDSFWEDPQVAADEGRPRRRFYRVTMAGEAALTKHHTERARATQSLRPERGMP